MIKQGETKRSGLAPRASVTGCHRPSLPLLCFIAFIRLNPSQVQIWPKPSYSFVRWWNSKRIVDSQSVLHRSRTCGITRLQASKGWHLPGTGIWSFLIWESMSLSLRKDAPNDIKFCFQWAKINQIGKEHQFMRRASYASGLALDMHLNSERTQGGQRGSTSVKWLKSHTGAKEETVAAMS